MKVKKDLTGMKFGHLTVLEQAEDYISPKGIHIAMWTVICDCGCSEKFTTQGCALISNRTTSCGCHLKNKLKKYNRYDLSGEYGVGYTSTEEEFWFDKEDYDLIKDYCWYYDSGYVVAHEINHSRKIIFLHNLIMAKQNNEVVDHINHPKTNENKYDNRKQNLRIITQSQNCMNQHMRSNNTSGVKGVSWAKEKNKWQAKITVNYEQIHLGFFDEDKFEDAVKTRRAAEQKYFGEYNFKNSTTRGDNIED